MNPRKLPTLPEPLRNPRTWLFALAAALFISGVLVSSFSGPKADPIGYADTVSVTDLLTDLDQDADSIASVTFYDEVGKAVVDYTEADNTLVPVPEAYIEQLLAAIVAADVDLSAGAGTPDAPLRDDNGPHPLLKPLGLILLFSGLGLALFLLLRANTGRDHVSDETGTEKGKKKHAGLVEADQVTTRFSDVAGCDEAVTDLSEMVTYLRDPSRFTRLGAKPPRGALLVGPPGTGKTLLARAVAGEAGVAFLQVSGSDFVEKFVGVGAKRVRELFATARRHEKAIVFIDELDAIARKRSSGGETSGGNTEGENTLIALLTELDGFADRGNVLIIGATNRADILDDAVTRPGRLDRKVEVPNPDRSGREKILAVHSQGKPVAADVDLLMLARRTPGFSGAQLAAVVNEACMTAARRDLDQVTGDCFDAAVATVAMGRARTSALVTDHDRRVTAWHEAGHTLAAFLIPDADDPVSVTIVPRGPAGGVTWMSGSDDIFLPRRKAHAQLVVALAGRAAEEALLDGEFTQGASGDLAQATQTATAMVTQYGMSELGYAVRDPKTAPVIDAVDALLVDAHARATALLTEHRMFLSQVAGELLEHETLSLADITAIADRCGVDRSTPVELPPLPRRPSPGPDPHPAAAADGVVVPFPTPTRPGLVAQAVSLLRRRRTTPSATA